MVGPDGEEAWCKAEYNSISSLKSFSAESAFCDAIGNINRDFPIAYWDVDFREKSGSTFVTIEIRFNKLDDVEKYIEMGFREGFLAAMENLDTLLE
jgi:PhnB protein